MNMKLAALAVAFLAAVFAGSSAEARPYDGDGVWARPVEQQRVNRGVRENREYRHNRTRVASLGGSYHGVGPRPSRWCGWWMRTQLGGGPEFNLARNWTRWGRPSGPRVGAVVVWPHHVGMITGRAANGQWIVKSGNDGGAVRERARSVSGAVFRVA
jgi:hypothetical protein